MREDVLVPANERRVRVGGLMRCCIASLAESSTPTEPGSTLSCQWCDGWMLVQDDGVWEWLHPKEAARRGLATPEVPRDA